MTVTTTGLDGASLTQQVAAGIRAWMGWLQVRQSELARRLGENDQWLSTRLRGVTVINLNELQRIAAALGVSWSALLPPTDAPAASERDDENFWRPSRLPAEMTAPFPPHMRGAIRRREAPGVKPTTSKVRPADRPPNNRPASGPRTGRRENIRPVERPRPVLPQPGVRRTFRTDDCSIVSPDAYAA